MGRQSLKLTKQEKPKKTCIKCHKSKDLSNGFYSTDSEMYQEDKKFPVCKQCIYSKLPPSDPNSQEYIEAVRNVLHEMNKPWSVQLWNSSVEESSKNGKDVFGILLKNLSLVAKGFTSKDSDKFTHDSEVIQDKSISTSIIQQPKKETVVNPEDIKNEEDVLRMLRYDPFESESKSDKRNLYNKLVDFLDEGTLEDSFKLPAVIEIVKSFNQMDKLNSALSAITADVEMVSKNFGGIKSIIDSKEKLLKSVLALAKDNGISVNHNNNKSKGGNTLNGIVKKLNEIGLDVAEVNLFDLETCEAMKQIADFSNKSILDQLMLDENDYTDMISEQKQMIKKLDDKLIAAEEENRLLKIKIKTIESNAKASGVV